MDIMGHLQKKYWTVEQICLLKVGRMSALEWFILFCYALLQKATLSNTNLPNKEATTLVIKDKNFSQ